MSYSVNVEFAPSVRDTPMRGVTRNCGADSFGSSSWERPAVHRGARVAEKLMKSKLQMR